MESVSSLQSVLVGTPEAFQIGTFFRRVCGRAACCDIARGSHDIELFTRKLLMRSSYTHNIDSSADPLLRTHDSRIFSDDSGEITRT